MLNKDLVQAGGNVATLKFSRKKDGFKLGLIQFLILERKSALDS